MYVRVSYAEGRRSRQRGQQRLPALSTEDSGAGVSEERSSR